MATTLEACEHAARLLEVLLRPSARSRTRSSLCAEPYPLTTSKLPSLKGARHLVNLAVYARPCKADLGFLACLIVASRAMQMAVEEAVEVSWTCESKHSALSSMKSLSISDYEQWVFSTTDNCNCSVSFGPGRDLAPHGGLRLHSSAEQPRRKQATSTNAFEAPVQVKASACLRSTFSQRSSISCGV